MWFLGVLERLLRPLMRTLSLQNDTSQGDGGPPLSSHSPSSVVDASNVASNTMIPPSPTCNKQKKKKKKKRTNYENLWNVARWTFVDRVFEQSSRHDYIFHEIFSPPRRKYPFSLRRKKISTTRFRKPAPLHGQSGFLLVRAFAPTCPTPPLQFAREPDVSSTTQTYPQVFSRNKGLSREYRYVYLKSETKRCNFI